jgi:hypothetical protein
VRRFPWAVLPTLLIGPGDPLASEEAAMELQFLPPYPGPPDSLRAWGEPDGHGKKPSMGLRDYVVFYLIILIGFPTLLCLADYLWTYDRHAEIRNFVREQEMEQENRRTLFSR